MYLLCFLKLIEAQYEDFADLHLPVECRHIHFCWAEEVRGNHIIYCNTVEVQWTAVILHGAHTSHIYWKCIARRNHSFIEVSSVIIHISHDSTCDLCIWWGYDGHNRTQYFSVCIYWNGFLIWRKKKLAPLLLYVLANWYLYCIIYEIVLHSVFRSLSGLIQEIVCRDSAQAISWINVHFLSKLRTALATLCY